MRKKKILITLSKSLMKDLDFVVKRLGLSKEKFLSHQLEEVIKKEKSLIKCGVTLEYYRDKLSDSAFKKIMGHNPTQEIMKEKQRVRGASKKYFRWLLQNKE